jgi:hypothetical protein
MQWLTGKVTSHDWQLNQKTIKAVAVRSAGNSMPAECHFQTDRSKTVMIAATTRARRCFPKVGDDAFWPRRLRLIPVERFCRAGSIVRKRLDFERLNLNGYFRALCPQHKWHRSTPERSKKGARQEFAPDKSYSHNALETTPTRCRPERTH